jgi:membrane protein
VTSPARSDPGQDDGERTTAGVLAAVPDRLRTPVLWISQRWIGRVVVRTATGLIHVQIFDRAMTLAAQTFTSVFPILIMAGAVFGSGQVARIAELTDLPDASRQLIGEALSDRGVSTFGVVGGLIVLVSSTGLARALTRAYSTVWAVRRPPSGPRAAWRWLVTVLTVAGYLVGSRLLSGLTDDLPQPHLWSSTLFLVADCTLAVIVPRLLLGRTVPLRMLLPGGVAFALVMLAVRPAGSVYLPRALQTADRRYGTIGLAFTYIGWLYLLAFCLLTTAVLGYVIARDAGRIGHLVRGPGAGPARGLDAGRPRPPVSGAGT